MNRGYFVMLVGLSVMGLSKISSIANHAFDGINTYTFYGTAINAQLTGDYLTKAYDSFNNSSQNEGRQDQHDMSCPEGLIMFQDKTLDNSNTTTTTSRIPRTIHFFSKSKCLPKEAHDNLQKWSDTIQDYSIMLHDLQDISTQLSKPRKDLSFVANALKCAFSHEAILDLARFVYLYDYGGISTDIDQLPAEGFIKFADGTMRSMQDEYYIELEAEYPRFIAAAPRSIYIYINMQLSIANQYEQFSFNKTSEELYNQNRNSVYQIPFTRDSFATRSESPNHALVQRRPQPGFNSSNAIYSSRLSNGFLTHSPLSDIDMERVRLGEAFDTNGRDEVFKQCVDFTDTSYRVDYEDLIQVAGGSNERPKIPCPTNLTFQVNSFTMDSAMMSNNGTRKIPKIIHMTSKGRCFTKAFADNIKQWTQPGYSFVLHDDEAVDKLFHNYEWSEFPLLRHILTCLTSGAMKADLWRYLALWKWGGVYTDIDNAPGREWFKDGTFIEDHMDAVFEVERGGYPSQYFYASK